MDKTWIFAPEWSRKMKLISSDVVTIFVLVEGRDDEAVRLWGHLMANIGPCKSFSGHIREPISRIRCSGCSKIKAIRS